MKQQSFQQHYEQTLRQLREEGKAFAVRYPKLAPFLGDHAQDPDIERLLEGFAFLTAKIHQNEQQVYPELTFDMLQLLYPDAVQPQPSCAIMQFEIQDLSQNQWKDQLAKGEILEVHVGQTRYQLQTCWPVTRYALKIVDSRVEQHRGHAHWILEFVCPQMRMGPVPEIPRLRFYLGSLGQKSALEIIAELMTETVSIEYRQANQELWQPLPQACFQEVGYDDQEALAIMPSVTTQPLGRLSEFLTFPEKFCFIDLCDLKGLAGLEGVDTRGFTIRITLKKTAFDWSVVQGKPQEIRLNCTPAMNLFPADAVPFHHHASAQAYPIRADDLMRAPLEIHHLERVTGFDHDSKQYRTYHALFSPGHSAASQDLIGHYAISQSTHALSQAPQYHIRFVDSLLAPHAKETISIELWVYQPELFKVFQNRAFARDSQAGQRLGWSSVGRLSPVFFPLEGSLAHSRLLSHLAVSFDALDTPQKIQQLLRAARFRSTEFHVGEPGNLRVGEGVSRVTVSPSRHLFRGQWMLGSKTHLVFDESQDQGASPLYVLGRILQGIAEDRGPINSFHEIEIQGMQSGRCYRWPPRFLPS